jgi:hypothetical protein
MQVGSLVRCWTSFDLMKEPGLSFPEVDDILTVSRIDKINDGSFILYFKEGLYGRYGYLHQWTVKEINLNLKSLSHVQLLQKEKERS